MIPHFVIDENLEEVQRDIKDLIQESQHPELKKHVKTLKKFVYAAAYSLAEPKPKIPKIIPQRQIQLQLVKQPIGYDISPAPLPGEPEREIHEFKAIPIYEETIIKKEPEKQIISLIKDKFTDKSLATATIENNSYIVNEPFLNESSQRVLDKIIKKGPKNPEKAWKLIEKYVRKYKAEPESKEAIKYYIINILFALGRIEPLLNDKEVSMIVCDSYNSPIQVKRNDKLLKTNIQFNTKEELDNFLFLIASVTKTKLDKKNPILDVDYRNFRFHCVLGLDIASSKFTITRI